MITVSLLLLAALPAPAPGASWALVVGNNRSSALARAPLQYADDDAAKYVEVLSPHFDSGQVTLLTRFDPDSQALYPSLARDAQPPTRAALAEAFERIGRQLRERKERGESVAFYFVFAGHGDVDEGRGFLELEDGPLTAAELERFLESMGATETHVILDSCNSFFVINPRKPGGRRFATPRDAAQNLGKKQGGLGVFLSTSAEAEVYEWSELQSGIFSHAVRSGLAGGADADLDGSVSYLELAAFVETATRSITNPLFRPKVFARGPAGDDGRALLRLSPERTVVLTLQAPEATRVLLRDAAGVRWLDVNVEAGATLRLHLPSSLSAAMVLERSDSSGRVVARLGQRQAISLEDLRLEQAEARARGANEYLEALFSKPFGPRAVAQWLGDAAARAEPVFGVSREDQERMALILGQLDRTERARRHFGFGLFGGGAVAMGALAPYGFQQHRAVGWVLVGGAAVMAGFSVGSLLISSPGERLFEDYRARASLLDTDAERLVASTEARLLEMSREEHVGRRWAEGVGWGLAGHGAFLLAAGLLEPDLGDDRFGLGVGGAIVLFVGVSLIVAGRVGESVIESLVEVWQNDPSLRKLPRLSVMALPRGGGMVALGGEF